MNSFITKNLQKMKNYIDQISVKFFFIKIENNLKKKKTIPSYNKLSNEELTTIIDLEKELASISNYLIKLEQTIKESKVKNYFFKINYFIILASSSNATMGNIK